jgi:palmitoyltransferase
MQCAFDFIPWKKVLVRATHLLIVFGVIASLLFQPSDLRTALYDQSNYAFCLAYGILVYLSIFFYFLTCYTDPGYVPYKRLPRWTGAIESASDDDENDLEQPITTNNSHLRKCLLCNIEQPLRSHHCDFCNRCVLKYDHHCPYLETCIGEHNHRYFWCFLLTTDILIVWSTILCSRSFVSFTEWSPWLHVNKFRLFTMHVLVICFCAVSILFIIHSFFALTNSTTWERVSRHRITYLNRLPDEDLNPFHQGYCHNFFCSFLCHRIKDKQQHWDVVYKKTLEEHVTLHM